MSKIWLIAKRELVFFFNSWVGYILIAATLFIDGLMFNVFALTSTPRLSTEVLSQFFYMSSGVVMIVAVLLSIRLITEEKTSSSIVLLYTSPIREREIVLGKFLSALIFFIILQLISVYIPALIFVNGKVSIAHILTGYIGLILLGSTIISIGLFASVISSNQLVAGVIASLIVVVFVTLWMLANVVDEPFKALFNYLALHNNHFTPFQQGIINTSDILFYFSVTFFFLECCTRSLEARRCQG